MGANRRKRGTLISFEGPDGCGKSTQLALLARALKKAGHRVLVTRQPGGTAFGLAMRRILLNPKNTRLSERAELFLYLADRAQHVQEVIAPALRAGKVVLADRYADSTWVYQGVGRKFSLDFIEACNDFAIGDCVPTVARVPRRLLAGVGVPSAASARALRPDLTFILDVDAATGLRRLGRFNRDRMESQSLAFHRRVCAGFRRLKNRFGRRVVLLDGRPAPHIIHQKILALVRKRLGIPNHIM